MSEIRATTISDTAGTGPATLTSQAALRFWINFDGTGTPAARDSLNLSSLTDNGTGDYTFNFTNAFGAADYGFTGHSFSTTSAQYITRGSPSKTTTALRMFFGGSSAEADYAQASVLVPGDLA